MVALMGAKNAIAALEVLPRVELRPDWGTTTTIWSTTQLRDRRSTSDGSADESGNGSRAGHAHSLHEWQEREPESVAADTTYGNGEFLQWLADRSITPYMRTRDSIHRKVFYPAIATE